MAVSFGSRFWFYARRALWIVIAWVTISIFIFLYEYITLVENDGLPADYDFKAQFFAQLIVSVSASLLGGIFTVNLMEHWLRRYAFWKALTLIFVAFTLIGMIVGALGILYLKGEQMGLSMTDSRVFQDFYTMYSTSLFIKNYVVWLFIVLLTLVFLMVNDKYGPGVFQDYLLGRYFHPKKESRIFMFADIRNATGIAEELGEARYFHLLKDFFRDIAPAVVETNGEVYQYVGDEVVISWKMKAGTKNANALVCFYRMKELIESKKAKYEGHYGVVPDFKVGFHCGRVMVGELGLIKRDIAFSGDVLNTAARIQAQCNGLGVDLLASEFFLQNLDTLPEGLQAENLGAFPLKGKKEPVSLITFRNEN